MASKAPQSDYQLTKSSKSIILPRLEIYTYFDPLTRNRGKNGNNESAEK